MDREGAEDFFSLASLSIDASTNLISRHVHDQFDSGSHEVKYFRHAPASAGCVGGSSQRRYTLLRKFLMSQACHRMIIARTSRGHSGRRPMKMPRAAASIAMRKIIADADDTAGRRFPEFLAATIRMCDQSSAGSSQGRGAFPRSASDAKMVGLTYTGSLSPASPPSWATPSVIEANKTPTSCSDLLCHFVPVLCHGDF